MPKQSPDISFEITAGSCIIAAFMLLLLPIQWAAAAAAAACFHEVCHGIAIILCKGHIHRISIGSRGAVIEAEGLTLDKELVCALAGPLGGLLLLLPMRWIPRIAVCALVHSVFNLLPVYPLDGGRALRCCAALLFPRHTDKICNAVEVFCLAAVLFLGIYGTFWLGLGPGPVVFAAALWSKRKNTLQTRCALSTIVTAY